MWCYTLIFICIVQVGVSKQEQDQPSNQEIIKSILNIENLFEDKLPNLLEEMLSKLLEENLSDLLESKLPGLLEDKVLDHIEENLSDMHYRLRKVDDTLENVKDDLAFMTRNGQSMNDEIETLGERFSQSLSSIENGKFVDNKTECESSYLKTNTSEEFQSIMMKLISLEESFNNKLNETSSLKIIDNSTLSLNASSVTSEISLTEEQCTEEDGLCIETGIHCNGTIKILYNTYEDRCTCCVHKKVPTDEQCTAKEGFCMETDNHCNGTLQFLHVSEDDHCTCCMPDMRVPTDEQCTAKAGLCVENGYRCNGTLKFLHNSEEDHCTCCVDMKVPTAEQCAEVKGLCMNNDDQIDRCDGTVKTLYNSYTDHCTCCVLDKKECLSPWVTIGTSEGCYLFVETNKNWDNAREYCQSVEGGDLAILDDHSKQLNMFNYLEGSDLKNNNFWLGATDRSGSWLWLNGNPVKDGWSKAHGEPNQDTGDNTCMYSHYYRTDQGILFDRECVGYTYDVICEK